MVETGWKPLPLLLKIMVVIFVLWIIGSILALAPRYEFGLPFFGMFIFGISAVFIVLLLDIIAPSAFIIGLWQRKSWAPNFAFLYIGIFVLNSIVALFTVRSELGLLPLSIPLIVNIIFFVVIYNNRKYCTLRS